MSRWLATFGVCRRKLALTTPRSDELSLIYPEKLFPTVLVVFLALGRLLAKGELFACCFISEFAIGGDVSGFGLFFFKRHFLLVGGLIK